MFEAHPTPFDDLKEGQTLVEALESTVRCARGLEFWRRYLPEAPIRSVEQFGELPFSSRADLSRASRLRELIIDPRWIFRSVYAYNQTSGTFPFQIVAGESDLELRHERILSILERAGKRAPCETLILASPAQYFFASDLCAEIYCEGHHASIQDVTGMSAEAIRGRIEIFDPELVVVATESRAVTPAAIPASVEALITFRGDHAELAELDAAVVDVYSLTEVPLIGHRIAGEACYRCNPDFFYLERSPSGHLTFTTLLWEVMPWIRYRTFDRVGELDDEAGTFEITTFGEW